MLTSKAGRLSTRFYSKLVLISLATDIRAFVHIICVMLNCPAAIALLGKTSLLYASHPGWFRQPAARPRLAFAHNAVFFFCPRAREKCEAFTNTFKIRLSMS